MQNINLKKGQDHYLATKIGKLFDDFDTKRQSQLNDINALHKSVYDLNNGLNADWNDTLELPNVYEQHQTLKAHLIESIYTSPESLFDVSTTNFEHAKNAIRQKIMLTDALEKMNIEEHIEKMVESIIDTGECTIFVGWKKDYKEIRRKDENISGEMVLENNDKHDENSCFVCKKKKIFDGVMAKIIPAQDFVFDVEKKSNWCACPKIFRTYITKNELENYVKTDLTKAEIEDIASFKASQGDYKNLEIQKNEKLIELLEFWGDIELEDGKYLKNYLIVVANRHAIIRFEPNPFIESPFIYANLIENPKTGRGISPLKSILPLNEVATRVLNCQLKAYSLIVNPPYLAPKGAFKGVQEVTPGKIIEYDSSLLPQMPTAINFSQALNGWEFVEYFKNSIEGTTGIYRTMAGTLANGNKTATELNYTANGQNARLNLTINTINRKLILPTIEKIASTIANFKFGDEIISKKVGEKAVVVKITDDIRCGDYIYKYADRKTAQDRKMRQKQLGDTISAFAQIPEFSKKIDWSECFKMALDSLGIENWERFLKNENI